MPKKGKNNNNHQSKWKKASNLIIDGITISFGLNNIAGDALASGGTVFEKIANTINAITGRTTGVNLIPSATKYEQVFNPSGIVNNQTISAAIAYGYNELAKYIKVLPLKAESRKFARKNLAVGIATGLFSPNPPNTIMNNNTLGTSGLTQNSSLPIGQGGG